MYSYIESSSPGLILNKKDLIQLKNENPLSGAAAEKELIKIGIQFHFSSIGNFGCDFMLKDLCRIIYLSTPNLGDMLLTPAQIKVLNGSSSFHTRGLAPKLATMWHFPMPDEPGKVAVPYKIDSRFSTEQQEKIFGGMQEIEQNSCIRWV